MHMIAMHAQHVPHLDGYKNLMDSAVQNFTLPFAFQIYQIEFKLLVWIKMG